MLYRNYLKNETLSTCTASISFEVLMEHEKGEIIEIPVENITKFTNTKQPDIGIIVLSFTVILLVLAIYIKNRHYYRYTEKYDHINFILI